jgi:ATP-binding cassette subfamily F protein 1
LVYDSRRVATRVRPSHRWASWRRNGETDECDSVVRRAPDGDRCVYARAEKASGAGADKKEKKEKKDKKEKKEKKETKQPSGGKNAAAPAPARKVRAPPPPARDRDDYLAGMDLPSSESEEESDREVEREEKVITFDGPSEKQIKRQRQKEIEAARKEAMAKAEAMMEDDDAFNVRIPNMSDEQMAAMANSRDIKIEGFSVSARGKPLLNNTSLTIAHGRRYGLVGPNGTGKTTVMKLLARRKIPVPEHIDILLVEQEVVGDDRSALQSVVAADVELQELRKKKIELEAMMDKLSLGDSTEPEPLFKDEETGAEHGLNEELTKTYEKLNDKGDATAEARAAKILHGLGFTVPKKDGSQGPDRFSMHNTTQSFSGGWRMRISLARALFIEPTCLLLDEPTNHLDLRAVIWLEEYLMRWKKTLVVVSHDRDFLSSVTTDIVHLHDHKLDQYKGSFDQFEEMYEIRRREANKAYEKYEKELKAAKKASSKSKQQDVKDKAKKNQERKAGGNKKNKGMMMDDDDDGPTQLPEKWADYNVKFSFPTPTELPPPLIGLNDCSFSYPGLKGFSLDKINLGIDMGTRVAVIGPNGAGKSTLMNLLAGDLEPTEGDSRRSHALRIGRYSQHFVDVLAMDENPVEYLRRKYTKENGSSYKPEEIRAKLGRFGLPGHNHLTPIVKLSGGQKARVVFTAIGLSNPHILLLDEPTNHLDMQSIDALADALNEFEGGVVMITHDAHICETVLDAETSEIWVVDEGKVDKFNGDFTEYRRQLVAEIAAELDDED